MAEDASALFNLVFGDMSWEWFEGRFQERYVTKEFVEHQLKGLDALRRGSHMVPEYEAPFWSCLICSAPSYPET
jgi:hypothetical protein